MDGNGRQGGVQSVLFGTGTVWQERYVKVRRGMVRTCRVRQERFGKVRRGLPGCVLEWNGRLGKPKII